ncbi:MAG: iron-containing alcohol dehydrogenase, partial [Bacteroidota bacterium]
MVEYFQHARLPHLIFGEGSIARLVELAATFGKQALILTGRQSFILKSSWPTLQRELTAKGLLFSQEVIAEEPSPSLVDEIVSRNQAKSVEVVIAIGGGSVIDAGKAVSAMLCHPYPTKSYLEGVGDRRPTAAKIPFIAVPTTAGTGSEATKNAVLSEVGPEGFKKSLRHDAYVPDIALLDPDLATTASPTVTAA